MVRVRWIRRWGRHVILISLAGDESMILPRNQAWELVHELQRALMTRPVAGDDHGEDDC